MSATRYLIWNILKQFFKAELAAGLVIIKGFKASWYLSIESAKYISYFILIYLDSSARCHYNLAGVAIIVLIKCLP